MLLPHGFGDVRFRRGRTMMQEAAGGEEFGVEQGGASGTSNEIVRKQSELDVEE